jgi:hypothetical protein
MFRPFGVIILAAFIVIQGIVNLAFVVSSGTLGPGQEYFIVTSVGGFAVAYGLMAGRMWGRYGMLVLAGLDIAIGLLGVFESLDTITTPFEGFASVLANLIVIYYLMRPEVVAYFRGFQAESFS